MSRSDLGEAALNGDLTRLRALIANGALLDGSDGKLYDDDTPGCVRGAPYYRPLGEAARMNHPDCVLALLDAGAKIDEVNYTGETALIQAVRQDALDTVKILLERGADVHHVACLGTALAATQPGYCKHAIEVGRLLLAAGCSPTATASYARSALERWRDQVDARGKLDKKVGAATLEMLRLAQPRIEGPEATELAMLIASLEKQLGVTAKAAERDASRYAKLADAKGASWAQDVGKLFAGQAAAKQPAKAAAKQPAKAAAKKPAKAAAKRPAAAKKPAKAAAKKPAVAKKPAKAAARKPAAKKPAKKPAKAAAKKPAKAAAKKPAAKKPAAKKPAKKPLKKATPKRAKN